jgi:YVTN family beta-propeller protein
MLRRFLSCLGLLLFLGSPLLPTPAEPPAPEGRPRYKSPLGLAVDEKGERAYVALHTAGAVAVVDLTAGKVLHEIPVGERPGRVAVDDGAVQVLRAADEEVVTVDPAKRTVVRRAPVPPAGRERDALLAPFGLAHEPYQDSLRKQGASNVRGSALTDGTLLFAHQRPRSEVPATQVAQGWVFTNALGVRAPYTFVAKAVPLDEPQRGYADPSDVAYGRHVFVACAGADAVVVVDPAKLFGYLSERLGRYVSDDLTAGRGYVVTRLPTQANPRRLALSGDGKTLVVSNHLADSLTVIDAESLKVLRHIPLGGPEPDAARRGEVLFNSARMTFHGQFTCASCHPDGGSDGLNWDLTRDGVGNFKNTKSLLGVRDSAPYGWHGTSPTLADRVAGTLRTLHRHEPAGTEVEDLVAYLSSLPPPRPLPVKDADRDAVARGREVFQGKGQCSNCHHRAALDDGKAHNVGTRGDTDTQDAFDTPALRGVARTAPYLHDGRAETLEEVFTKHNPKGWHGAAHTLSKEELGDLIAYLKSL